MGKGPPNAAVWRSQMGMGVDASRTMLDGSSGFPEWVAKGLGLSPDGARTAFHGTANGTIQQMLVTLDIAELGTAKQKECRPRSVRR
jgi:hypothetical protein